MGSIGMLTVSVKQTDIITAATPVQNLWLSMSNLDLLIPPLDVGVFFCYKKPTDENSCIINLIKQSLSLALVPFYPLAGEVVYTSQGEPELLCNNHGVELVHAYASLELKDLDLYHPDDSIEGKLVPLKTKGVLSVQVTEFNCGGLVIGCTFDHRVADAHSMNMFLVSWAEITRSKPVSYFPSFRRSMLHPRRPPLVTNFYNTLYVPFSSLPPPPTSTLTPNPLISRIYYIEANDINNLQTISSLDGNPQSKLISFISYLWKIIANGDEDFKTCRMGVVVDGRERLNDIANFENLSNIDSFKMQNYFGNVLSIPSGEAISGELKEMPLREVAKMVHKFVSGATTKEHFRGLIDWVEVHRPEKAVTKIYTQREDDGGAVVVSSGMRFQIERIDFGWGKPQFGSYHFPWGGQTGYVMPMPSVTKNGDWVVYMHLLQKHLDLVEAIGTKYFRPLTSTYLGF